jgi:hypothetical protein
MQIVAGVISSLIFASATSSMVYKAWHTKDLHSYSKAQLILNNVGNVLHWFYIASLPFGPLWLLHGFFTMSMILMLAWAIIYGKASTLEDVAPSSDAIIHTQELVALLPVNLCTL